MIRRLLTIVLLCAAPVCATDRSWAFAPVVKPPVPGTSDDAWVRNPIDAFILAKLQQSRLKPAPPADRHTLIRRLSFDLIGLPPTPEEIRAFVSDKSPDAYEKLIDRLLASPHYGERWGRHWLDVARYVPGRINFPGVKNTRGDQAYRDYVVRAFNQDKPYDQFITEQIAGDLLPPRQIRQDYFDQITAPAFLSIGGWFDMETDPNRLRMEMVDEQINTTSKALLGLTVGCARCHDHKTDPISTSDYYALGGIFASTRLVGDFSEFWRDGRVRQLRPLAMPQEVAANNAIQARIDAKKAEMWAFLTDQHTRLMSAWRAEEARYRDVARGLAPPYVKSIEAEQFDGQDNLRIAQLMRDGKAIDVLETQTPGAQWVKYKVETPKPGMYRMEGLYSSDDPAPLYVQVNGKTITETALNKPTGGWDLKYQRWANLGTFELRSGVNFLRIGIKNGSFPRLDRLRLIEQNEATEKQIAQAATKEKLSTRLLTHFTYDPANPWPTISDIAEFLDEPARNHLESLQKQAAAIALEIKPYEQIIAVTDQSKPVDLPVHVRGETYNVTTLKVPRGPLHLFDASLPRPEISSGASGRLELAAWLTDSRNPLVARVMVNRIWQWHFSRGIVATPSDFGATGATPTHPQLLDWLANEFVTKGWSIKHLHQLIVTSNTYRMASLGSDDSMLLSHFPRKRLDADAIYDAMRSTNNMIPRQAPGAALDREKSAQRAMYILSNGRVPQGMSADFRKFLTLFDYDLTTAATTMEVRSTSQTTAQSLFWMNSPLVKYMADRFAERLLKMDKLDDSKRVDMAYQLALGREPGEAVRKSVLTFIEQAMREDGLTRQGAWSEFCQSLYGSAEFRYVE